MAKGADFEFKSETGEILACGFTRMAEWPDESLKWVLFDLQISVPAHGETKVHFAVRPGPGETGRNGMITVSEQNQRVFIDTGALEFRTGMEGMDFSLFNFKSGESRFNPDDSCTFILTDEHSTQWRPVIQERAVEHDTVLKKVIRFQGGFRKKDQVHPLLFTCRMHLFSEKPYIRFDFTLTNPQAACHPQNTWDLGDKNSVFFKALRFVFQTGGGKAEDLFFCTEFDQTCDAEEGKEPFSIYQDSSGKEHWDSKNHINKDGDPAVSFRGYKVFRQGRVSGHGERATPAAGMETQTGAVYCFAENFWQNFPKEMNVDGHKLELGLFPEQKGRVHELQPGEQKTHTFYLGIGKNKTSVRDLQFAVDPLKPVLPAEQYYKSLQRPRPVPLDRITKTQEGRLYYNTVENAVKGNHRFDRKNDRIDEFGWRHFGDVYADHEAVYHQAEEMFISHYNNQYDVIKGAVFQYMSSGDPAWFDMAKTMADHVYDIDIYHTDNDRNQFNRGLFWHTDHHLDARTCTHRTVSKVHEPYKPAGGLGGGPAPDHNYATGFLYLYWMTGELRYKAAVLELASNISNWLLGPDTVFDLGFQSLKSLVKRIKTGENKNYDDVFRFDGPGRASGNSLNTLLDAYLLTSDAKYLDMAENLIGMCVSPADDPDEMDLLNAELRWMYTVFLNALGRYLDIKRSMEQVDACFDFGRKTLVRYALWMEKNEYPYLEKPEILEFPTETWAAQDIRKADIFAFAAAYAEDGLKERFLEKSGYFLRHSLEELAGFETWYLTRPLTACHYHDQRHGES